VYAIVVTPGPNILKPALSHQLHRTRMCLAFDSATERKRLSPVPLGWDEMPVAELLRLLAVATTISKIVKKP
jgi:hypothetical protein